MAKKSSVFYKVPIEDMRGKLATKQKPIMYSGQEEGQNTLSIGEGLHQATNFEKYIVLTKRRSKNFFYVKSRTSVRNTLGTNFQRATLAVASDIADYMKPFLEDGTFLNVQQAFKYWAQGKTFREWLTSLAMTAVSTNQEYITCQSQPDPQTGLVATLQIMKNPLYSFDTVASEIRPEGALTGAVYTDDNRTKGLLQEYFRYYSNLMRAERKSVTVVSEATGKKYAIVLLYQAGSPTDTFGGLVSSVQGASFNVDFDTANPQKLKRFSIVDKNGVVLLTGVNISDGTNPVTADTRIDTLTQIVVG